jgi:hypothetical protein
LHVRQLVTGSAKITHTCCEQSLEVLQSRFVFDDSQLAKTTQLIDEIDSRLSAEERMANSESRSFDRIPVQDSESQVDLMAEIANYFGNNENGDEVSTQVVKK